MKIVAALIPLALFIPLVACGGEKGVDSTVKINNSVQDKNSDFNNYIVHTHGETFLCLSRNVYTLWCETYHE